jgi:hypothetical protein
MLKMPAATNNVPHPELVEGRRMLVQAVELCR